MTDMFGNVGVILYTSQDIEIGFKKSAEVMVKNVKDKFKIVINTQSGFPKATITLDLDNEETKKMMRILDSCLNNKR